MAQTTDRVLGSNRQFQKRARRSAVTAVALLSALAVVCSPAFCDDRSKVKPPWNMYSPETDIKLGRQNAEQIERQMPMCNDPRVDAYLTKLGMKLVAKLPMRGVEYPWEFHCVNSKEINAFALPGGFVFVNRGAIEVSDDEAQLAAVMAHELSHVALRHGTAQASKTQFLNGAAGIFGALFGGTIGGALATEGVSLGAGSILLHYSRGDETQADVLGTQVLHDAGYDPRAMAQFFEKIEAESKGKNPPQFLSDHPNPGNRVERVDEEIDKLGGVEHNAKRDSAEFESIKREVLALPIVGKGARAYTGPPPAPSRNTTEYKANAYSLQYPDNWTMSSGRSDSGNDAEFVPPGGIMQGKNGRGELAYGIIVTMTPMQPNANDPNALQNATQQYIQDLQKSNPNMAIARSPAAIKLDGAPALSTRLNNDSPAGGQENDLLITVMQPDGMLSFLSVAPQSAYDQYNKIFTSILNSVRLAK